ncbi:DUF4296 domain-containing protein [Aquirufa rosea]|uniref:DUF4296 domain-containing protein n=1 Tax=Aquirufa rosea TaxID=2509241 RepID=A0A4Q1BYN7_9BACT|nr:DUF4296 domain-containing protein [Aquirufa rosea]RXK48228.1 DUF4296 domain-containing protein [Aquirufa rosea]
MRNLYFLLCLVCWACGESSTSQPIEEDKLAEILVDIHIEESKVSNMHFGSIDSSILVYHHQEKLIFKKYGVDSLQFAQNFDRYVQEPKDFLRLYDKVNKIMEKRFKKPETSHR